MERVPPRIGPKPANFDETQTASERAVLITCCTVVAVAIALRTLGRYALKLKMNIEYDGAGHFLGLDDVFNFFAVLTFYGFATAVFIAVDRGMGTHIERVIWLHGTDGLDDYSITIYFSAIFYNTTLGMIKLSVLALYRRILQGAPSRTLSIMNYTLAGIVAANTIINVSIAAFQCNPIRGAFDSTITDKKCINQAAFYLGNAGTGIATDAMVYLMSIPIIRPLQMGKKQKWQILLTLLVGLFAVITSCVRIGFLPALLVNPDATWAMGVPMDWSIVEAAVGILVSSMPATRSIMYLFSPSFGRSQNSTSFKSNLDHSQGHIQLHDFNSTIENQPTISAGKKMVSDDDSEKNLIYQGTTGKGISKTTVIRVTSTES